MTPEQKELVRASFDFLLPAAQSTAELFYSRLFEMNPSLRPMFMSDMRGQARKFISMVRVVVTHMDLIDQVILPPSRPWAGGMQVTASRAGITRLLERP